MHVSEFNVTSSKYCRQKKQRHGAVAGIPYSHSGYPESNLDPETAHLTQTSVIFLNTLRQMLGYD
jgi:hypothetical protein